MIRSLLGICIATLRWLWACLHSQSYYRCRRQFQMAPWMGLHLNHCFIGNLQCQSPWLRILQNRWCSFWCFANAVISLWNIWFYEITHVQEELIAFKCHWRSPICFTVTKLCSQTDLQNQLTIVALYFFFFFFPPSLLLNGSLYSREKNCSLEEG